MLINCVVYEEGRKLADIDIEDIDQWLLRPGCFVWVALCDATHDELRQMQEEFDLHELAVEDARFYAHSGIDPISVLRAGVSVVYFAAKWLFLWEPTLAVILGLIFGFLLLDATV